MKRQIAAAAALIALASAGCTPLTFSNEGAIDFERYRSCRVERLAGADGEYATEYLTRELSALSGFTIVTSDPRAETDLELDVRVTIHEEVRVDSDGDRDFDYEATAIFSARTPDGAVVDTAVVVEESDTYTEALEDALDAIAHHYLLPYRA